MEWSVNNSFKFVHLRKTEKPTIELEEKVLSDPVNAWKMAIDLHVVVTWFVSIVFTHIILVVIRALKDYNKQIILLYYLYYLNIYSVISILIFLLIHQSVLYLLMYYIPFIIS